MKPFTIYGKPSCPFCDHAKNLLDRQGQEYSYVDVASDEVAKQFLVESGFRTVPQIYHGSIHIGGYTELSTYITSVNVE